MDFDLAAMSQCDLAGEAESDPRITRFRREKGGQRSDSSDPWIGRGRC